MDGGPASGKESLDMNKINRHILFLFVVIALLTISTSVVFAKELGLLTISGPGIKGEVSLNDHEAMMDLEQSGFFDQAVLAKPPQGLSEGYNITAHLNLDGKLVPFIQMVYYPTAAGQSAYVHYTARLEGETLQPVDEWHLLNLKADTALRDVMAASSIKVQSALVSAPAAVAPLIISGPGIKGEVTLKDPEAMMNLGRSGFFDYDQAVLAKPPQRLGEGYNLTAHLNLDGKIVPYIQMVYYPTNEGQSAYVHYTARLEGETLQPVDIWHLLNPKADGALRAMMTANNITVQSALVKAPEVAAPAQEAVSAPAEEPLAAPATSPRPPQAYLIPILVVGFLALMGVALAIKRRTVSHPTT
jgi:hypothetical protein